MNSFSIGDKVQLNSGGPAMRVDAINSAGLYLCSWLDDEGVAQVADFEVCMLVHYRRALDSGRIMRFRRFSMRYDLFLVQVTAFVAFFDVLSRRSVGSVLVSVVAVTLGLFLCWVADKLWERYAG